MVLLIVGAAATLVLIMQLGRMALKGLPARDAAPLATGALELPFEVAR